MTGKRMFQGRDAMCRMNFLYQAADICRNLRKSESTKLAMYYSSLMTSIGRKAQARMDPQLKRILCKGCNTLLVPGDTVVVRVLRKPDPSVVWVCLFCGVLKIFRSRKDYIIWSENSNSVVETIKCSNDIPSDLPEEDKVNDKVQKLVLVENKSTSESMETSVVIVAKVSTSG